MKTFLILLLLNIGGGVQATSASGVCPPAPYTREQLLDLKQSGFQIEDDSERNALAVALMACVGATDPEIRDGIVFEGTANWLREQKLTAETTATLYNKLLLLIADQSDENGFQQPFAALILSEVARTDRIEAIFSAEKRAELVEAAAVYLSNVRDYRGFSESGGWRHGVAHGADLVLQLVLNENINAEQVSRLLDAVATQVSPSGEVFYIYGEPGRLARAVFYAYRRGVVKASFWQSWFDRISDPGPLEDWGSAHSSQAGLAQRHNTLAFLAALNVYASSSDDVQSEALAALTMSAFGRVN